MPHGCWYVTLIHALTHMHVCLYTHTPTQPLALDMGRRQRESDSDRERSMGCSIPMGSRTSQSNISDNELEGE